MKGYISFVLVLASLLLVLALLELASISSSTDLSKAVAASRTYGVHMNIKENILEACRQGAQNGFFLYDTLHDVEACRHCPDSLCSPLPAAPNPCNPALCSTCFRESEARAASEAGVRTGIGLLRSHVFDKDFTVQLGSVYFEVFLKPDSHQKNGFALDYGRFRERATLSLRSEKFGISSEGSIPRGVILVYG